MRTTLDLPDPLFREVKSRAAKEGLKLKELIALYIENGLRTTSLSPGEPRGHADPLPVAIARESGSGKGKAMTNRELNALLDHEEVETFQRPVPRSPEDDR